MLKKQKLNSAVERLLEEKLYEQVGNEVSQGTIKTGLWVKALAESNGDEAKAKAIYIQLRSQSLIDESVINQEAAEKHEQIEQETIAAEKRLKSEIKRRLKKAQLVKVKKY